MYIFPKHNVAQAQAAPQVVRIKVPTTQADVLIKMIA
jgi:hypothetical protein